ncbi:MAG: glycosyltransferase family 4 protein [Firmicutes bacterium]|nr:glycosyltransferase family 4 protein [Bacillota bacterium]
MTINEYLNKNYKKIIGWGTGGCFKKLYKELNIDLEYLIDSNESRTGQVLEGYTIFSPSVLQKEELDDVLIVIFSIFHEEICETINKYGDFCTINGEQLLLFGYTLKENNKILEKEEENKDIVISISRNDFSLVVNGLNKFVREQMVLFNKNGYINIHLFWRHFNLKGFQGLYFFVVKDGSMVGSYRATELFHIIERVKTVIIHSLATMDLDALDLILEHVNRSIPVLYYIHDFSSICSHIKLMYNDKVFCRSYEDGWRKCATCESGEKRKKIFEYHKKLFQRKNVKIIVPSNSTKEIIQRSFNPGPKKIQVILHQKYRIVNKENIKINPVIKVAYVGYKDIHKGWDIFKRLVGDFRDKYKFYCFGASDEIIEGVEYVDVSFITDGEQAMTKKLVEYGIDVSLLLSLWPETYSYTYFESFAAGAFVVTTTLSGNIYDQIQKNKNGIAVTSYQELKDLFSDEEKLRSLILRNKRRIVGLRSNEEEIFKHF